MAEADDFVEAFLEHRGNYDPRKAREYYLRTRKLVGRKAKQVQKTLDNAVYTPAESAEAKKRIEKRFKEGGAYDQERANRKERIAVQERKLNQARERAKKLPPEKRNAVEKKLDAAERRLKKVKRKLFKNPFKTKTIDRSGPVVDRNTGRTYTPKTGWQTPRKSRAR